MIVNRALIQIFFRPNNPELLRIFEFRNLRSRGFSLLIGCPCRNSGGRGEQLKYAFLIATLQPSKKPGKVEIKNKKIDI